MFKNKPKLVCKAMKPIKLNVVNYKRDRNLCVHYMAGVLRSA